VRRKVSIERKQLESEKESEYREEKAGESGGK
jgi:hypothetical protein